MERGPAKRIRGAANFIKNNALSRSRCVFSADEECSYLLLFFAGVFSVFCEWIIRHRILHLTGALGTATQEKKNGSCEQLSAYNWKLGRGVDCVYIYPFASSGWPERRNT